MSINTILIKVEDKLSKMFLGPIKGNYENWAACSAVHQELILLKNLNSKIKNKFWNF